MGKEHFEDAVWRSISSTNQLSNMSGVPWSPRASSGRQTLLCISEVSLRLQYGDACESVLWNVCACIFNHFSPVWLVETLWAVVHQALLSMGLSQQEYWSELPCPPSEILPNSGMEPTSHSSPALQANSLPLSHWRNTQNVRSYTNMSYHFQIYKVRCSINEKIFWALSLSYALFSFSLFLCCSQNVYTDLFYK